MQNLSLYFQIDLKNQFKFVIKLTNLSSAFYLQNCPAHFLSLFASEQ